MLKMRSAKLLLLLLLFTSSFFLMAHVYLRTYKHKGRHAYTIHMYTHIPTPHKRNTHTHTQPSNTWTFVYKIDFIDFIYIKNEILKSKWNHVRSHTHTHTFWNSICYSCWHRQMGCGWHRDKPHCFCVRHSANQLYFITKKSEISYRCGWIM